MSVPLMQLNTGLFLRKKVKIEESSAKSWYIRVFLYYILKGKLFPWFMINAGTDLVFAALFAEFLYHTRTS